MYNFYTIQYYVESQTTLMQVIKIDTSVKLKIVIKKINRRN